MTVGVVKTQSVDCFFFYFEVIGIKLSVSSHERPLARFSSSLWLWLIIEVNILTSIFLFWSWRWTFFELKITPPLECDIDEVPEGLKVFRGEIKREKNALAISHGVEIDHLDMITPQSHRQLELWKFSTWREERQHMVIFYQIKSASNIQNLSW